MDDGAKKRLVPLTLFVAVVAVSFAAIFFKKALPTHPIAMSGIRLAVAALVMMPFTVRGIAAGRLRGRAVFAAILAGVFYGLHFGAWVSSLAMTSIAASVTLVTTTPLLLGLLGWATGRDRPDRRVWVALGVASVGVIVIGGVDASVSKERLAGDGLALLGAAAMAGYLLTGRRLGARLDVLAFSGVATAVGAASLLAAAVVAGIDVRPASGEALVYIVLAALIPQLVGHNLLTWSLRHTKPVVVGTAVLGEPVGATFLGWLLLGEPVPPIAAMGCVLALVGVVIALRAPQAVPPVDLAVPPSDQGDTRA